LKCTPEPEFVTELTFVERIFRERSALYDSVISKLEALVLANDRLYMEKFAAAELALSTALAAQEKGTTAAFLAGEKAVLKAEQAQKEYNERSNEFRGQLDDQAKTLMPRPETVNMFKALDEKLTGVENVLESRITGLQNAAKNELESAKTSFNKALDALTKDVSALREYRSEGGGKEAATRNAADQHNRTLGIVIAVSLAIVGFCISLYTAFRR